MGTQLLKVTVAGKESFRHTSRLYTHVVAAVTDGRWGKRTQPILAGTVFSWHLTHAAALRQLVTMTTLPKKGGLQVDWVTTPECLSVVEVP